MESTGIVCGVAGRLAQGTSAEVGNVSPIQGDGDAGIVEAVEISFLSTARTGTVIVKASELERAVRALEEVMEVA